MANDELLNAIKGEKDYFNQLAMSRAEKGISCEMDMRTETFYEPQTINEELIDSKLKYIFLNPMRKVALEHIFGAPDGQILDVCCGPGWFSLEAARAGRSAVGFDISGEAIALARNYYQLNKSYLPGSIEYVNESVEIADLSNYKFTGVMGWSAFHHLNDPNEFLERVYHMLPKGGVIVTFDDLDSGFLEKGFRYALKFLFPIYEYTYFQKIKFIFNLLRGKASLNVMSHSPMEIMSDKHGMAAEVIRNKMVGLFSPIYDIEFGAFSVYVCMSLKGPKLFRYAVAHFVVWLDRIMCKVGVCKGSYRIIVSIKK